MHAAHDLFSRHVYLPAHRLYRRSRRHLRGAVRAFTEGLEFRSATLDWNEERRIEWVRERLRHVVRHAVQTTDHYRDEFGTAGLDARADLTFDEFARLPVLEREHVRAAGDRLLSKGVPPRERRRDSTGGSSGVPTQIWTGPEERGWRESGIAHFMMQCGMPPGTRTAYLWGHHLDPVARDSLRDRVQDWLRNVRWFDCLRLSPDVLMRYHGELERFRPACIIAYAGALATLAEELESRGVAPTYPTTAMVTGAEKLYAQQREVVERIFGKPVHERYGSRDVGLMAFQTRAPSDLRFDVDWTNVLIEPEGIGGTGAVLVTKLHADAMPMIRYRIGDVARFPASSRAGHPTFLLEEILGRDTDRIWLKDGSWVHGLEYPHMMKDFPVREFQVEQRADYHVTIRVVPSGPFPPEVRERLLRTITANLPGIQSKLELVNEIPRGPANKMRPVITHVRPATGGFR